MKKKIISGCLLLVSKLLLNWRRVCCTSVSPLLFSIVRRWLWPIRMNSIQTNKLTRQRIHALTARGHVFVWYFFLFVFLWVPFCLCFYLLVFSSFCFGLANSICCFFGCTYAYTKWCECLCINRLRFVRATLFVVLSLLRLHTNMNVYMSHHVWMNGNIKKNHSVYLLECLKWYMMHEPITGTRSCRSQKSKNPFWNSANRNANDVESHATMKYNLKKKIFAITIVV